MGYFDDMKVMLGRGMNVADRKTQELRLQAELSRIGSGLDSAYAALGKVLYSHPTLAEQIQRECPGEYNAVTSLLQDEQNVRSRIGDLQRQTMAPVPRPTRQFLCTKCGTPVTLDLAYCPNCGDNLSELKVQYRMCPNCGTYHTSDSMFCMQCGSQTVEIPVSPTIQHSTSEGVVQNDGITNVDPLVLERQCELASEAAGGTLGGVVLSVKEVMQEPTTSSCPNCGASIASSDMFCGECGARLMD